MATSKAAAFSSRISPSLRHLLLTRSTAIASSAAFSLTGKIPTTPTPTPTPTEKLNLLGRVDWPAFPREKVVGIEASSKRMPKVDSDDDEESGDEFDDEFDGDSDFCEDDVSDEDDDDEDSDDVHHKKGKR